MATDCTNSEYNPNCSSDDGSSLSIEMVDECINVISM